MTFKLSGRRGVLGVSSAVVLVAGVLACAAPPAAPARPAPATGPATSRPAATRPTAPIRSLNELALAYPRELWPKKGEWFNRTPRNDEANKWVTEQFVGRTLTGEATGNVTSLAAGHVSATIVVEHVNQIKDAELGVTAFLNFPDSAIPALRDKERRVVRIGVTGRITAANVNMTNEGTLHVVVVLHDCKLTK